jgi:hypothetical protein
VLADQLNAETGDELLAPDSNEDDPLARDKEKMDKENQK